MCMRAYVLKRNFSNMQKKYHKNTKNGIPVIKNQYNRH